MIDFNKELSIDKVVDNYFLCYPHEEEDDLNDYTFDKNDIEYKSLDLSELDEIRENIIDLNEETVYDEMLKAEEINDLKIYIKNMIDKFDEIDKIISENVENRTFNRIAFIDLIILRIAIYEMIFDDKIDIAVAINEAVLLARTYGSSEKTEKFVNAVLSKINKNNE